MVNEIDKAHAAGKVLGDQLRALHERAGITKKYEDARLGPMPDMAAEPDGCEYDLEVEDYARRKVRNLYFGVQDLALRKELIAKQREFERFHAQVLVDQLKRDEKALAKAQRKAESPAILAPAIYAVICVSVGAYFFQLYGAIAGALVAFFVGQAAVAQGRSIAKRELEAAQAEYDEEVKGQEEVALRPPWFNAQEERTGERDKAFDQESVIANYYDAQRREAEAQMISAGHTGSRISQH